MPSDIKPRPEISALSPNVHGGLDYGELSELGISGEHVLDFSVNRNPYGPPESVRAAWDSVVLERYPDRECLALRQCLAALHDCSSDQVWAGNGTVELIWLLALAYVRPGDNVAVLSPTFGEYETACRLMGANVILHWAAADEGFEPNLPAVVDSLKRLAPRLVFLCNPNNPTGVYLERRDVEALAAVIGDGILVLDEAYVAFVDDAWSSEVLLASDRVAILRSMTKDYALAGLRLGYLLAASPIVDAVQRAQPPWSVNAVAQAAGCRALEARRDVERTLARTAEVSEDLVQALRHDLMLDVLPSMTHFFLVRVGDAAATRSALLQRGMLVRDCTSFGLPEFVRIASRRPAENRQLVAAWRDLLRTSCI